MNCFVPNQLCLLRKSYVILFYLVLAQIKACFKLDNFVLSVYSKRILNVSANIKWDIFLGFFIAHFELKNYGQDWGEFRLAGKFLCILNMIVAILKCYF